MDLILVCSFHSSYSLLPNYDLIYNFIPGWQQILVELRCWLAVLLYTNPIQITDTNSNNSLVNFTQMYLVFVHNTALKLFR